MIVTTQFLFIMPTLYILTLGPLLGMRQSVQFRYVFGFVDLEPINHWTEHRLTKQPGNIQTSCSV